MTTATLAPPTATIKPEWIEATADAPCLICGRSEGCRSAGDRIVCVWIPRHHLAQTKFSPDGTTYGVYDRRTFRHFPPINDAVELLLKYFFSRTDVVAFDPRPEWNQTACPASGNDALPHLLRAHLGGDKIRIPWQTAKKEGQMRQSRNWRIGSYGPAPDGTTRWIVCDFDGGEDHADPLADPLAVALSAYRQFWRAGIACYLERSRSCSGWHLWVFFSSPMSAAKARTLADRLLPKDALTIDGHAAEIEVFPKRDTLDGARLGHQVWLPWYCQAAKGGNAFYRPTERGLIPFIPEDFQATTQEAVDRALARTGGGA